MKFCRELDSCWPAAYYSYSKEVRAGFLGQVRLRGLFEDLPERLADLRELTPSYRPYGVGRLTVGASG